MGGQQFGTDTVLVDVTKLNRILHIDKNRGLLEVEGGIEWQRLDPCLGGSLFAGRRLDHLRSDQPQRWRG